MFNQPLNLDTSSVTDMTAMFYVRSARALPPIRNRVLACTRRLPTPSRPQAPMPPASHVLLSTLQNATAFNQPLSFDTSKVTDMQLMGRPMFGVRCLRRRRRPTPTSRPTSRIIACPPFDSAGL